MYDFKVGDGVIYKGRLGVIIDISSDLAHVHFEDGNTLWLNVKLLSRVPEVDNDIELNDC